MRTVAVLAAACLLASTTTGCTLAARKHRGVGIAADAALVTSVLVLKHEPASCQDEPAEATWPGGGAVAAGEAIECGSDVLGQVLLGMSILAVGVALGTTALVLEATEDSPPPSPPAAAPDTALVQQLIDEGWAGTAAPRTARR